VELTLQSMRTLSDLIDQALALDGDARTRWLDELSTGPHAALCPIVQEMLSKRSEMSTRFLSHPLRIDGLTQIDLVAAALPKLEPSARVGAYTLLREVGRGGMGVVWLAERSDGQLKRQVALKLPMLSASDALAERFVRERNILSQLEHPNIARLYDAGVSPAGQPFLALEYVSGEPITAHCDRKRLDIRDRLARFLDVARAVQFAHANLVVHRDLKPSNILVTDDGAVRLLDFGVAKLLDDSQNEAHETELTRLVGRALTLDYASPEQLHGGAIGIASDVYSLGVILYLLLCGVKPYLIGRECKFDAEKILREIDPKPPSIRAISNEVDSASAAIESGASGSAARAALRRTSPERLARLLAGDLDTIVAKAMRKASGERYSTVAEFAADIERYLQGLPVTAQPESRRYRMQKFVRRNKIIVGATTAVAASIVAGLGVALWQTNVARDQARRADQEANVARLEKTRADQQALAAQRAAQEATVQAARADEQAFAARREATRADQQTIAAQAQAQRADQQAAAAKRETDRAEREAKQATIEKTRGEAVQSYLVEVFDANSVHQRDAVRARNLSAKELLERGAARLLVNSKLAEDVTASLYRVFGTLYENLNDPEQARKMHQESVRLSQKLYGKRSKEYAQAMLEYGWFEGGQRLGSLLAQITEARTTLQQLTPNTEAVALAWAYEAHNAITTDPRRTLVAANEALRVLDQIDGSRKTRAIAVRAQAHAHRMLEEDELAIAKYRDASQLFSSLYGTDNIEVADAKGGVASILNQQLRLTDADTELNAALQIARLYDGVHADSKAYGRAVAKISADLGRPQEAIERLLATHSAITAERERSGGIAFALSLDASEIALSRGDLELAYKLIRRSRTEYDAQSPRTLAILAISEAQVHLKSGDFEKTRDHVNATKQVLAAASASNFAQSDIRAIEIELALRDGNLSRARELISAFDNEGGDTKQSLRQRLSRDLLRAHVYEAAGDWRKVMEIVQTWVDKQPQVNIPMASLCDLYLLRAKAGRENSHREAIAWAREAVTLIERFDVPHSKRTQQARSLLSGTS
jgi:eukaryotic-like serine/threonine-protein kinase